MCKGLAALPQTCLERAKEIKSKLGVLLQKPDNAIDLIIPYPEKVDKKPEKLQKPTPEEAAQWRESLDRVLNNNCRFLLSLLICSHKMINKKKCLFTKGYCKKFSLN
ncbi:Regulator of G-protein signaling 5 [Goodea atripinnis]|uniref:Regulator of G-protein signaling 5 n=1 Tax=Goodea atripinnis TaxID=208336 RepID=A0ABV0MYH6_9TELE